MESELWPQLDDLEDNIDAISTTLKPLIEQNLPKNASLLPLVDKAKLYILTTYAIESLIFSYLETSGVKTTEHPIMKELTRIRQYFGKIRDIEAKDKEKAQKQAPDAATQSRVDTRDNLVLDKDAAGRFINAALSGNDKYDEERAENIRIQKERAHVKFQELGEGQKDPMGQRAVDDSDDDDEEEEGGVKLDMADTDNDAEKTDGVDGKGDESENADEAEKKRKKMEKKKRKRELSLQQDGGVKKPKKDKSKKEKKKDKSRK